MIPSRPGVAGASLVPKDRGPLVPEAGGPLVPEAGGPLVLAGRASATSQRGGQLCGRR